MEKDEDEEEEDGYPKVNSTLVIFADVESKSRLKVINREVNMVAGDDNHIPEMVTNSHHIQLV